MPHKPPRPFRLKKPRPPRLKKPRAPKLRPITAKRSDEAVEPVLTAKAQNFLRRLGCTAPMVTVVVTPDGLASAAGVTLFTASLGQIRVGKTLMEVLDAECLDFVLAHEVAHIWENHMVATGAFAVLRAMLDQEARSDRDLRTLLAIYDMAKVFMFASGQLPIDAALTKAQELDADALAARLVGSVDAGHRALLTLVGGDRAAPSHTWEVFKTTAPVMTVGERLDALDARFGILRWPLVSP
ncbi:MAG: hypothetical protein OHK0013_35970 [Sandaracinaceae bacterium]